MKDKINLPEDALNVEYFIHHIAGDNIVGPTDHLFAFVPTLFSDDLAAIVDLVPVFVAPAFARHGQRGPFEIDAGRTEKGETNAILIQSHASPSAKRMTLAEIRKAAKAFDGELPVLTAATSIEGGFLEFVYSSRPGAGGIVFGTEID